MNLLYVDNNPLHYMTHEEHEQFRHDFPKVIIIIFVVAAVFIFVKAIISGSLRGYVIKQELNDERAREDACRRAVDRVIARDNERLIKEQEAASENDTTQDYEELDGLPTDAEPPNSSGGSTPEEIDI